MRIFCIWNGSKSFRPVVGGGVISAGQKLAARLILFCFVALPVSIPSEFGHLHLFFVSVFLGS
jgi:hypothetical protein